MESAGAEANSAITKTADEKYYIIDELIKMSVSNVEFYHRDKSFIGVKMHATFEKLIQLLEQSVPVIKQIESFAGDYDFDAITQGNGYRSFAYIFHCAVVHTEKVCKYILENRGNLLFRKSVYLK